MDPKRGPRHEILGQDGSPYDACVRIAFDEQVFAIQQFGGISRLFSELAKQYLSDPDFDVQLSALHAPVINHYLLDDPRLSSALQVRPVGSGYRALAHYFTTRRPRPEVDVLHNTFYLPHGLAGYPGAKRVVTIHDMIPELLPRTRRRLDMITLKRRYVERADHVICVSQSTRHDLVRTFGSFSADISVIPNGVDPAFMPGAPPIPGLPSRYVLFVGHRGQYKDADVLLRGFAKLAPAHSDMDLVFVGGGPLSRMEQSRIANLGLAGRVHQFALADAQMAGAYGNAAVFVFPSRFEGFGLPAVEAMACGTATLLADGTSLPEVGGDAAAYFRPADSHDLARRLQALLEDPDVRTRLGAAGIARARQFSWRECASSTAEVYRRVLG